MIVPPMTYSRKGIQLTESFEGLSLESYQDLGGIWTIGYGHTGSGVGPGMACTQAQAEQWLEQDYAWAEGEVNAMVGIQPTQGEFDALTDFTFNCGRWNFDHSTLLRLVNEGDLPDAARQFERWDKVGGKVVAGLLRRRLAEEAEFLGSPPLTALLGP
jgi:lysozyme